MSEIMEIDISSIDPESEINVRRQGIDQNVEKVKLSIQQHGYWADQPITVRPHPKSDSVYKYQHVTGQCRLKACLALEFTTIPTLILDLSDEEAIQRSWLENEVRGDLLFSDKAYWTERIFKKYSGDGHTPDEALELAAQYLGVGTDTVRGYYRLAGLPDEVMDLLDRSVLTSQQAQAIVYNTYDGANFKQSQEDMKERAEWILAFDRDGRQFAVEALNKLKHKASIAELTQYVAKKVNESRRAVTYIIPDELHDDLLQWGRTRGLEGENTIVGHIVADALRREET